MFHSACFTRHSYNHRMSESDLPPGVSNPAQALQLAFAHQRRRQLANAIDICRVACERWPAEIDLLRMQAALLHQAGDSAGAIELLNHAIVQAPANAQLHNSLGNILMALGRDQEAMDAFNRA